MASDQTGLEEDAWKQYQDLLERFTEKWQPRRDLRVYAYAWDRCVEFGTVESSSRCLGGTQRQAGVMSAPCESWRKRSWKRATSWMNTILFGRKVTSKADLLPKPRSRFVVFLDPPDDGECWWCEHKGRYLVFHAGRHYCLSCLHYEIRDQESNYDIHYYPRTWMLAHPEPERTIVL